MKRIFVSALLCLVMISAIFGVTAAAAEGPLNGSGVQAYGVTCSKTSDGRHLYEKVVSTEATCTEAGVMTLTCSACGETFGTTAIAVDKNNHANVVIDSAVAATCTEKGLTEGSHCADCNVVIVAQTDVSETGHTTVIDPAVAATCTAAGLTEGSHCSVCKEVLVARTVVDALGHTEEVIPGVKASCTISGWTDGTKCSTCQVTLKERERIESTGHTTEYGICDNCGEAIGGYTEGGSGSGSDDNTGGNTGSGSDDNTGSGSDDNTGSGSGGSGGSSSGSSSSGLDNVPKTGDITPYGLFFMAFMTVAIAAAWIGRRIFCAK